jgi:glycosyltransferase involved in cell wall biosynthesis
MDQPLISIIIPVYNASQTIEASILSAINQTYLNREIIVIDGGSDSKTIEQIRKYQNKLAYFISEKDNGIYDAINKGIGKAQGEWIYILGADDQLAAKNVLELIFSIPLQSEKLVFGNVAQTNISHSLIREKHVSALNKSIIWRNTLHQQSVFYHRILFYNFRFNTLYRVLADYDLHLLLYQQHLTYRKVNLTIATCSAEGISKNFNPALYKEELLIKKKRLGIIYYTLNIVWVWVKFLVKKMTS